MKTTTKTAAAKTTTTKTTTTPRRRAYDWRPKGNAAKYATQPRRDVTLHNEFLQAEIDYLNALTF